MMIFTRTLQGTEQPDGTFGAPTTTTISGDGVLVRGTPQEYEAAGLVRTGGPTVLFTPHAYPLRAYTPEFVLPGDTVTLHLTPYTVTAILSVVAPDGYVIVSRLALGV